jgi:hypothetical protein
LAAERASNWNRSSCDDAPIADQGKTFSATCRPSDRCTAS